MSPHRSIPVAEVADLRGEAGAPHPTRAETERERAMMSDQNTTFPLPARPTETHGRAMRALADDEGAATAEYVVATMAAVSLAGVLVMLLRGDAVKQILMDLVRTALSVAG